MTRSPALNRVTSSPTPTTSPAPSLIGTTPGTDGNGYCWSEDERIAPVQRDGPNSDDDLGGLRRWLVGLAQHDPVDLSRAFQMKRAHSRQGVLV